MEEREETPIEHEETPVEVEEPLNEGYETLNEGDTPPGDAEKPLNEGKKPIIEALLFTSGVPVTAAEIKSATGIPEAEVRGIIEELSQEYKERESGILIGEVAGGFQMYTDPSLADALRKYKGEAKAQKLSLPALETLAIIAYKQPIIKAEVEELRGVNSDGVIKTLLDRRLVKIVGKKEAPGRPMLYATTKEFLEYFGLKDLGELPTLKDMERQEAA